MLRGKADTATTDSLAARLTDVEGKLFYTKLLDYISSKSGSQIDLDVSDLDLTKYDSLEIRLDPSRGQLYHWILPPAIGMAKTRRDGWCPSH